MKKLFLALLLSAFCFSGITHALTEAEEQEVLMNRAESTATGLFTQMEAACGAANKEAVSYKESIPYQITAGQWLNEAMKHKASSSYVYATEGFTLVINNARSALSLCAGTDQLPLSDKNYDSALTKNVVMRLSDRLTGATQDKLGSVFKGELLIMINRVLGAIGILYIVIIGIKYIFARGEDEDMTRYKTQFLWIILGLIVISLAEFIGYDLLNPSGRDVLSMETSIKLSDKVKDIVRFMEYAVGAFILITAAITAYQLILVGGGEEANSLEKKFFKSILLGSVLILMSEIVVRILSFSDSPEKTTEILVSEVAGIVNFSLSFVAIAAMAMLTFSSLYFVISFGNEDQTTRAKRMIKTSLIGVILASASYVLVRFLIQ